MWKLIYTYQKIRTFLFHPQHTSLSPATHITSTRNTRQNTNPVFKKILKKKHFGWKSYSNENFRIFCQIISRRNFMWLEVKTHFPQKFAFSYPVWWVFGVSVKKVLQIA